MIGVGGGKSYVFLKNVNTSEELNGYSFVGGIGYSTMKILNIGGELLFDDNKKFIGIRVSGGLAKDIDGVELKLPVNVYGSVDNSIVTSSKFIKKSKKEIEKQIGYDLDRISELAKDKTTAIKKMLL